MSRRHGIGTPEYFFCHFVPRPRDQHPVVINGIPKQVRDDIFRATREERSMYNKTLYHHYYVYIITNKRNTTFYIGVTNDLWRRMREHKNGLIKGFSKKYNLNKKFEINPTWIKTLNKCSYELGLTPAFLGGGAFENPFKTKFTKTGRGLAIKDIFQIIYDTKSFYALKKTINWAATRMGVISK